jgi:hypothetical protein
MCLSCAPLSLGSLLVLHRSAADTCGQCSKGRGAGRRYEDRRKEGGTRERERDEGARSALVVRQQEPGLGRLEKEEEELQRTA